jgi:hypothetical protein
MVSSSVLMCGSLLLVGAGFGCGGPVDTAVLRADPDSDGTLQMRLVSELDGQRYGLQATLTITGPESLVLSSLPSDEALQQDLAPGAYTVALGPDFQVYRLQPPADPEPVAATLLSDASQAVQIASATTSRLSFRFALAAPVVIPAGALAIDFSIENATTPVDPPVDPPVEEPATSFAADVWPIFMTNCTPCHSTLNRGGHSVGSAMLAIADADARRLGATLVERLDGGGMPQGCDGLPGDPGCIAIADLALVQLWIDTGMAP